MTLLRGVLQGVPAGYATLPSTSGEDKRWMTAKSVVVGVGHYCKSSQHERGLGTSDKPPVIIDYDRHTISNSCTTLLYEEFFIHSGEGR